MEYWGENLFVVKLVLRRLSSERQHTSDDNFDGLAGLAAAHLELLGKVLQQLVQLKGKNEGVQRNLWKIAKALAENQGNVQGSMLNRWMEHHSQEEFVSNLEHASGTVK